MPSKAHKQAEAEEKLAAVADLISDAAARRDRVIVETAEHVSRRQSAFLVGLTPGRVQQIVDSGKEQI